MSHAISVTDRIVSSLCRAAILLTNQPSNADRCLLWWILYQQHGGMKVAQTNSGTGQLLLNYT